MIVNSRFQVAQDGKSFIAAAGLWTLDQWRCVNSGFTIEQGSRGVGAKITLTADGVAGIFQPIESVDTIKGDILTAFGVNGTTVNGLPSYNSWVLGWTGAKDKPSNCGLHNALNIGWQIIDVYSPIPDTINNLALLIEINGEDDDSIILDKAYIGKYEPKSYPDDLRDCSRFYQVLGTKYHANEMIGYGRVLSGGTDLHMELPLPFPIRGADGAEGILDVSVSFGEITFNNTAADGNMWVYAAALSKRVIVPPVLTCVHRQNPGLGFTVKTAGGLAANQPAVMRTYYATQAAIDAAVGTDMIKVDARLK